MGQANAVGPTSIDGSFSDRPSGEFHSEKNSSKETSEQ